MPFGNGTIAFGNETVRIKKNSMDWKGTEYDPKSDEIFYCGSQMLKFYGGGKKSFYRPAGSGAVRLRLWRKNLEQSCLSRERKTLKLTPGGSILYNGLPDTLTNIQESYPGGPEAPIRGL